MENIIIGTAGHIDHGKTAMIYALTGRDTDTLKEEKQRKISIDLGFTYFDLPDGNRAGVIDVPGHEKFLPNMLAGVCGIDLVLLVIALDEGSRPQTREHMDILEKLHVPGGILVLTKADCVEEEWADMMEGEIREHMKGTIFEGWPCQRISSVKGTGIEELKALIVRQASCLLRNRNTFGRFRMPVDRVMSIKGFGTVIAGTVMEGSISCEEKIMLYPSGQTTKVKSIQIHGKDAGEASAGQRAALLLSGIRKEEAKRGDVAAFPDSLQLSRFLDVKIEMVSDTKRVLKNQTRVHLHIGTDQLLCRVSLLDQQELKAGQSGYAQLVLKRELAVKKKDRFVIRFFSPLETIGGGMVLEERPAKHKRFDPSVLALLKNKEEDREEAVLLSCLEKQTDKPVKAGELEQQSGIRRDHLDSLLEKLEQEQACVAVRGRRKTFYWTLEAAKRESRRMEEVLWNYRKRWPFKKGMEKSDLKNTEWKDWEADRFDAWMDHLEEKERIQRDGTSIHLYGFVPVADTQSERLKKHLYQAFANAGFDFVRVKELRPSDMEEEMYQDILAFLSERKEIIHISDDYYTTPKLVEEIRLRVRRYFEENQVLSVSSLRDLLQNTRRSAKAAMVYLDEQKITKSCGRETERVYRG